MLSHSLKMAAYRYTTFNSLIYKYLQLSYFSTDFHRDCGRLNGLIRACISESLAFTISFPFIGFFKGIV